MPVPLSALLAEPAFALRLVTGDAGGDRTLAWAHSSDLHDPTPWLRPGGLLLTDGGQFDEVGEPEWAEAYVGRLVDAGVAALGFGVEVLHAAAPGRLVAACVRGGLPLLAVPRRTPFMAIIRFVVDAEARDQRARLEWSLDAQRAVARAALRPDGLTAVLRELERRLGCWVALFDAAGHRVPVATRLVPPPDRAEEVRAAVRRALDRGTRAGVRLAGPDGDVTLQTLGHAAELSGVLAVGTPAPLDPAGHDLVTSVIALASIALDQSSAITDARRRLRSGLFELMLAGQVPVAARTAESLWGPLPPEPVRVSLAVPPPGARVHLPELELLAERRRGRVFVAEHEGRLVAVTPGDEVDPVRTLWERQGLPAGCSTAVGWSELPVALAEAGRAAARAGPHRLTVRFEELVADGLLGVLEAAGGAAVAHRLLQPLVERPAADQQVLLDSAAAWLEHNGAWDPAARQLGVHRHTLRNRLGTVERLLGLDLDRFGDRAELWTSIQLIRLAAGPA